jgi:hypothetical protein
MLDELLKEVRAGGSLETGVLAARLGTSPQLIVAMLDHLQRLGLIKTYVHCADGCQGCSLQGDCARKNTVRLWQSVGEE